jgi:hypothetical protein
MDPEIDRLRQASDAKSLLDLLPGVGNAREIGRALDELPDPSRAVESLVAFFQRQDDFIAGQTRAWLDHWRGMGPPHSSFGESEARDSALADYVALAFPAIRTFAKAGDQRAADGLRLLASSGADPDVRADAASALARVEGSH